MITITIHHTPKTILRNYLVRTKELWSHTTKLHCGDSSYALIAIDCKFPTAHYTLHTSLLNTALSTLHTSQGKPSALWSQKKGSTSKLFFCCHILFIILQYSSVWCAVCSVHHPMFNRKFVQCNIRSTAWSFVQWCGFTVWPCLVNDELLLFCSMTNGDRRHRKSAVKLAQAASTSKIMTGDKSDHQCS